MVHELTHDERINIIFNYVYFKMSKKQRRLFDTLINSDNRAIWKLYDSYKDPVDFSLCSAIAQDYMKELAEQSIEIGDVSGEKHYKSMYTTLHMINSDIYNSCEDPETDDRMTVLWAYSNHHIFHFTAQKAIKNGWDINWDWLHKNVDFSVI